jgi:hypothetical protein
VVVRCRGDLALLGSLPDLALFQSINGECGILCATKLGFFVFPGDGRMEPKVPHVPGKHSTLRPNPSPGATAHANLSLFKFPPWECSLESLREPGARGSACNPSCSGGRAQEDQGSKPAWGNSLRGPILKKPHHKKGLVVWLKVKALSSSPSTAKKKPMRSPGHSGSCL